MVLWCISDNNSFLKNTPPNRLVLQVSPVLRIRDRRRTTYTNATPLGQSTRRYVLPLLPSAISLQSGLPKGSGMGEQISRHDRNSVPLGSGNDQQEQDAPPQQLRTWFVWFFSGCCGSVSWLMGSCLICYPQRYCYLASLVQQGEPSGLWFVLLCGSVNGLCLNRSGWALLRHLYFIPAYLRTALCTTWSSCLRLARYAYSAPRTELGSGRGFCATRL